MDILQRLIKFGASTENMIMQTALPERSSLAPQTA